MYPKNQLLEQQLPALPKRRTDTIFRAEVVTYIMRSRLAMNGKLLIVAFYERISAANGFSLPSAVLFQTKNDYITMTNTPNGRKWKKSRITHVLDIREYSKKQSVIGFYEQDEKRIRSFLPLNSKTTTPDIFIHRHIENYQDVLLEKRSLAKKKRVAEQVDIQMQVTPKLPDAFMRWVDREPLLHSRYVYYKRITNRMATGFCTHCKKEIAFSKELPVHNGKGVCPSCHSEITFKAAGKAKKVFDNAKVAILQKTRDGNEFMLRFFSISRSFITNYKEPEENVYERARLIFTADGTITGQFKNGWCAKTGRCGWYQTKNVITGKNKDITWEIKLGMYRSVWNVWFDRAHLYSYNLRSMLTGLNLSYDIIRNIKGRAVDVTSYLMRSMTYPFAPSLWRIGLPRLCADLLEECYEPNIYLPTGALHTRFCISKEFMNLMRKYNLGMEAVKLRAPLDKEPDGDDFLWMLENRIKSKDLGVVNKYTTFHKIRKYIERQMKVCRVSVWGEETTAQALMEFWKDYVSMCEKLSYDLSKKSVLYPKHVKDEHDKVQQLIRIKHDPVMDEKIKDVYPELNGKYAYLGKKYLIRPPKDFNDFIKEGVTLLHCVCSNGYYRGHVAHESYIFFLRRKDEPETPFYTIEFEPDGNKIRQCYGYRHAVATDEVKSFADRWKKRLTGKKEAAKAA